MEMKHATTLTSSDVDLRRGRVVPWVIAGFFVAFMVPLLVFTWIAFEHAPSLVTQDAYDKGLRYNHTIEASSKQRALGWHARLELKANNALVLTLVDRQQQPLRGAMVKAWFVRPAEAGMDQTVMMTEIAPGQYEAAMPHPAPGLWEARITALSGGKQFQAARPVTVR